MKTIQDLILDVQDRISLPLDDEDRWSTAALVRAFNNALDDKLTPDLVAEGSNYLVHRDVIPLKVNGVSVYPLNSVPLPVRAVGRALREVKYLPAGKTKIEEELNCPAISLEEKDMFVESNDLYTSDVPYVFIENDNLRLVGGSSDGSIVFYYSLEPSTLQNTVGQYATITNWQIPVSIIVTTTLNSANLTTVTNPISLNISAGMPITGKNIPAGSTVTSVTSNSITISANATATESNITATVQKNEFTATAGAAWDAYLPFTPSPNNTTKFVDIYRKSTGAILKSNVKLTRASSLSYTNIGLSAEEITQLQSNQPGGFPVSGPYESDLLLLPAGKAEFATIPYEFDQLLVLYVCERVLESLGDTEGLQVVMTKIKETHDSISRITGNRLQGERRKLTDRRSIARIQRGHKWTRNYNKNFT